MNKKQWQFWIDRGGTFTDVVAKTPEGNLLTHKLLSDNPEHYQDAAIAGIRHFLKVPTDHSIPVENIKSVKMGTTVATNALLERKGEPVALITNQGFADALKIGYQNRPDIFALNVRTPKPLYQQILEVTGRLNAEGEEIQPLAEAAIKQGLKSLKQQGFNALAIVLLHSYLNPEHEKQIAIWAKEIGFSQISTSSATSALVKYVSRGRTTVVDAYLSPVLHRYVQQVTKQLPNVDLQFMQSHGGLCQAKTFQGKDAILSGPAGGIIGAVKTSQHAGIDKIIGFDMGGTSTDVSHYAGQLQRNFDNEVAGVQMRVPMLDIHTVAAGGGSIITLQQGEVRVGPESAGANPGPTAYRRGGPLTVTDANVLLGRIQPSHFPNVFGENADQALDMIAVRNKFAEMANALSMEPENLAQGALDIAIENMANAVKTISTQRGYDLHDYTLVSFGGAGGQHACLVAEKLGIQSVLLHPYSGVLSAYGMGLAQNSVMNTQSYSIHITELTQLKPLIQTQRQTAIKELQAQNSEVAEEKMTLHLHYQGSDTSLDIQFIDWQTDYAMLFSEQHQQRFGFQLDADIVVHSITIEVLNQAHQADSLPNTSPYSAKPIETVQTYANGAWQDTLVYQRNAITQSQTLSGPALILETTGTIYLPAGWNTKLLADGQLQLTQNAVKLELNSAKSAQISQNNNKTFKPDPIKLGLYNHRFMSIAEQMGAILAKTAHSVNIKERLDFSCALFDQSGQLIANAPHVPVHLGSMGESVKTLIQRHGNQLQSGDAYALNNPFAGGTHLPDITVISPVFIDDKCAFYVASRGHHADVGGLTPGSMPADSTHIEHEGVLLDCVPVLLAGKEQSSTLKTRFLQARYPARNWQQNWNDLQAQIAANQAGINGLQQLCRQTSLQEVKAYMNFVLEHSEAQVKALLPKLSSGEFCYQTDHGSQVCVEVRINQTSQTATIDFSGSSEQQNNNFNAPFAITRAATLYVLRTLINQDISLNDGFLRPIELIVPTGSILHPNYPAAVVAGNVETSQVVTDALYGALQIQAASQGTMNNLTFGDKTWQYYETLCGGTGAGKNYKGEDAVHSHMTNSRLTDPEIFEQRYPVRLKKFAIRENSGGKGKYPGGNGCERHIEFLQPMMVSVLSNHRQIPPYGMQGGEAGKTGRHGKQPAGKTSIKWLPSTFSESFEASDTLIMQTPGGGGFGTSDTE
ncbi:hydantoinase B/oxoprolinase family protein [Thiomicrorhabdus indica]|uniref:hydantoinase B/oxoprolinase family protein n=1 Tax=Thiomicrorhabdus indica TaxID=2267253 RepID=UPI002AA6D6F9|nr:hydantoinase B/oxoprolinase family protein [Thiomicrorhabdus indica]